MEIIVDTNILISGILKDSTIRKMLLNLPVRFLLPEYAMREIEEHLEEIKEKTGLINNEFYSIYKIIKEKMEIVSFNEIDNYKEKAIEIVKAIDEEDALIIATALAKPNSILWSEDKNLKNQNIIKVLNTSETINFLNNYY